MKHIRTRIQFVIALIVACSATFPGAFAQSAQPPAPPTSGRVAAPDYMLYFFLFDHITRQDSLATQQTAAGKNGDAIKTYYATTIGLSASDFQILHDTALTCRGSVKQQDEAAAVVIKNFRAAAAAARSAHAPLPPVPGGLTAFSNPRMILKSGTVSNTE